MKPICPTILRPHISSTLKLAGWWTGAREELLLLTAAQETHCGEWRRQMGNGPGRGIYSIEALTGSRTEEDIWKNFLSYREDEIEIIRYICGVSSPNAKALEENLSYQHLIACIKYRRVPEIIPSSTDIPALAKYWDDHFNCNPDHGFPFEAIKNYNTFILQK